jgi:hypothetical protein
MVGHVDKDGWASEICRKCAVFPSGIAAGSGLTMCPWLRHKVCRAGPPISFGGRDASD